MEGVKAIDDHRLPGGQPERFDPRSIELLLVLFKKPAWMAESKPLHLAVRVWSSY
jgi:hypothetical protein